MSTLPQQDVMTSSPASLGTRSYVWLVTLAAIPCLLVAVRTSVQTPQHYLWLILTAITLITVPFIVSLPGGLLVTIGDAFIISICMIYGTSQAVIANAIYTTLLMLLLRRRGKAAELVLFNIAVSVLNPQIYGLVYEFLNPYRSFNLQDLVVPTFGVALTYFLSNSIFVGAYMALRSQESILKVWGKHFSTLALDFLISSTAAGIITTFGMLNVTAPLFAAPCVGAIWALNKITQAKKEEAEKHLKDQEQLYLRTVESLALAVDAKDQTTYGHIRRVRAYALGLAKLSGLTDPKDLMTIDAGSLLHDIGKLAIDDNILKKQGRLNEQELEMMKVHVKVGDEILQKIQFPFPVAQVVRCHHERWDGLGYPDGLKGEEIPLGARITSIADAFDNISTSHTDESNRNLIEYLRAQAGTLLDPRLVQLFIEHIDELEAPAAQENIAKQ